MDGKKVSKSGKLKKIIARSYIVGFLSCALLVGIAWGAMTLFDFGRLVIGKDYEEYTGINQRYGKYYELLQIIDQKSLYDYSPEEIDDDTIREVIKALDDPYAEYFTAEEYKKYLEHYENSYTGIGVLVTEGDEGVEIYGIVKGQPADEAGLKTGDIILEVDGKKVNDLDESTEAIQGPANTELTIKIKRGDEVKEITLNRAKIDLKSVSYKKYDKKNKIGYIYISSFKEDTAKEFKLAVKDLKSDGYNKVIIDVRENGGGLTKESLAIADYLLPEGKICIERDKNGNEKVEKSDATSAGIEYVLIINEHSASASELLAGAIQDNEGGKIVGTTSFGKGVMQRTYTLSDGSVVKLTIAEYFTPKDHKVNGKGITPDVVVENGDGYIKAAHDTLLHK